MEKTIAEGIWNVIFNSHKVPEIALLIAEYFYSDADWFNNFYITPEMEAAGYQNKYYDPENKDSLSQAAHSMENGPLIIGLLSVDFHIDLFNKETLSKIAKDYVKIFGEEDADGNENPKIPQKFRDLVDFVHEYPANRDYQMLDHRSSVSDKRLIYLLTGALLVADNWYYLSDYDFQRIARAHGTFPDVLGIQLKGILKSQIQIFRELIEKVGTESALYEELLTDNEKALSYLPG